MSDSNNCLNCEAPLVGEFCSVCGQSNKGINRFFLTLINEAFEDVFTRNSRFWKTLVYLLFRPGLLSQEYCKGRRVSYIRPVKLYFFTSIIFFVTFAAINFYTELSSFEAVDSVLQADQVSKVIETGKAITEEVEVIDEPLEAAKEDESEKIKLEIDNDLDEFIESLHLDQQSDFSKLVEVKFKTAVQSIEQDPSIMKSLLLDFAPPVIFCFLPLFALLFKLCYLTKRIYYTEHLILALHNHSFLFLISTINLVIGLSLQSFSLIQDVITSIVSLWIPIYMWLSMKNVYQQSGLVTSFKYIILGTSYFALVLFGIVLCFIFGVMTF